MSLYEFIILNIDAHRRYIIVIVNLENIVNISDCVSEKNVGI